MKLPTLILGIGLLPLFFISTSMHLSAQDLTGKWLFSNESETAEFTEEGIFRVYIKDQGYSYGFYELADGYLSFMFLDMEDVFFYPVKRLDNKKLILLHPENGESLEYTYLGKHEISIQDVQRISENWGITEENLQDTEPYSEEDWSVEPDDMVESGDYKTDDEPTTTKSTSPTPSALTIEQISGQWKQTNGDENMLLSSSEYFETISPRYSLYGIWGIADNNLQLAFVQGGNFFTFEITHFEKGRKLFIKLITSDNSKQDEIQYAYVGEAPTYPKAQIDGVLAQFWQANANRNAEYYQQASQMQQREHNTIMGIINNMDSGYKVIIRDEHGRKIGEY